MVSVKWDLANNMLRHKHEIVAYDVNPEPGRKLADLGAVSVDTIEELVSNLKDHVSSG
ncbi:hypothetical protein ERICIV_02444 [Paenibacillus larvae subsp. larvae]|uniref:6-phosphogluconate dehydrogenase NADP-binding domain-containing protein n=1 Tax=Paenibacillus larvae subsp. larvae TaxID=147375 RepID=A0A2L1U122_9BACL|nr:hypothetical protein ERICIII_02470 [Paenibacillus larvae subsp. larvae]AVF31354.1 hypothetical protein ERICIV_02444 [Paenibacillus larvae subsp. larvae]